MGWGALCVPVTGTGAANSLFAQQEMVFVVRHTLKDFVRKPGVEISDGI